MSQVVRGAFPPKYTESVESEPSVWMDMKRIREQTGLQYNDDLEIECASRLYRGRSHVLLWLRRVCA